MSRLVDAETIGTIRNALSSTSSATVNYSREAKSAITPYLQYIVDKCIDLWNASKPYLKGVIEFTKSPHGLCLILLSCTFVLMKISQSTDDRLLSTVLMITGIVTAITLGAYLLHTGLIPLHFFQSNVIKAV